MKIKYFAIPLTAALLLFGCKHQEAETVDEAPWEEPETVVVEEEQPVVEVERVPVLQKAKPAKSSASGKTSQTSSTSKTSTASKNTKAETIYVETDGAQGRVWGHVTMNGDRGTGTIHDWDENTWAVNVTRHGDELFAVDQNSRLYVFKLNVNKNVNRNQRPEGTGISSTKEIIERLK